MKHFALFLTLMLAVLYSCAPTSETASTAQTEKQPTFTFRVQLELKDAEGMDDSLIQSVRGKNDVVVMDSVVVVNETDLNKIEFKKDSKDTRKIIFYFNKLGSSKITSQIKKRKRVMAVITMNGEVYEVVNLVSTFKNGVLRLGKSITAADSEKLKSTMSESLIAK